MSLDWFADTDTAESSAICRTVSDDSGFDVDKLLWAADRYAPAGREAALIYGAGFEGCPDLLRQLAHGRVLWGNIPETMQRVKTSADFFQLLDRLGIPYPEVRWVPPEQTSDSRLWLVKQGASQGGQGVRFPDRDLSGSSVPPSGTYFQRKLTGAPRSALFLANGEDAEIVGFNTLWFSDHLRQQPFLFAGAQSHCRLRQRQRADLHDHVLALTRALSLQGINSLDFMIDNDEILVLEINPRPSATMTLYDADYPEGLLACHRDACRQRLIGPNRRSCAMRCFKILYAHRSMQVPSGFDWPNWCADRPRAGTFVRSGQPVCSIQAESHDRDGAMMEQHLCARERVIRSSLMF